MAELVPHARYEKPCTGGPEPERSYRWPPRFPTPYSAFSAEFLALVIASRSGAVRRSSLHPRRVSGPDSRAAVGTTAPCHGRPYEVIPIVSGATMAQCARGARASGCCRIARKPLPDHAPATFNLQLATFSPTCDLQRETCNDLRHVQSPRSG